VGETFSEGRESVTDKERSERPATNRTEEMIAKICQIVHENHRLTVRSIAEHANIDRETFREEGVCKNGPKGAHRRTKAKKTHNLPRPFGEAR